MEKNKLKFVIIISMLIIIFVGTFIIFKVLKHKTQNILETENEEQNIVADINKNEALDNSQNNENNTDNVDNVDNKEKELANNFEESKESKINTAQSNTNTNINIPKNQTTSTQNNQNNKEENNQKATSTEEKKQEDETTDLKEIYTFKRNDTEIQNIINIAKRIIKENKNGRCDGLVNQIDSINFIIGKAGNLFYPLFDYRIENIVVDNYFPEFYVYAEDIYLNGNFLRTEYYFN